MLKVKLAVNDIELELGFENIEEITYMIPDEKKYCNVLLELLKSKNSEVRSAIASKENINSEIVNILINDPQINVVRSLIANSKAQAIITQDKILELIDSNDSEILETIALSLESFELCDEFMIGKRLSENENPHIRGTLSENPSVPTEILKILSYDTDINVSNKAKDTLEDLHNENREKDDFEDDYDDEMEEIDEDEFDNIDDFDDDDDEDDFK